MVAQQKLPQVLQLTPSSEIVFQGPFEHVVTSYLELKNPSDKRVCFKVKTTAPRRYCVRPNSGIVDPNGKIKIAIMLQPMDAESQAERNKHKFMVQSTIININNNSQLTDEIWQSATSEEIMDSKLRCVFQVPDQEQQEQQNSSPSKRTTEPVAEAVTTPAGAATAVAAAATTTSQQQPATRSIAGDKPSSERMVTSTPVASRVTSSTSKPSSSYSAASAANVSAALSANRSSADKSSFLHPMGDDYKIVLVSLAMLILGVILGKYII